MLKGVLSLMNGSICKINCQYLDKNEADFGAPLTISFS